MLFYNLPLSSSKVGLHFSFFYNIEISLAQRAYTTFLKLKFKQFLSYTQERELLGELTFYRSCFDVHYYELDIEILPESKSIQGTVPVSYTHLTLPTICSV